MGISYNKLFKMLIYKDMNKYNMAEIIGVSLVTIAKYPAH